MGAWKAESVLNDDVLRAIAQTRRPWIGACLCVYVLALNYLQTAKKLLYLFSKLIRSSSNPFLSQNALFADKPID